MKRHSPLAVALLLCLPFLILAQEDDWPAGGRSWVRSRHSKSYKGRGKGVPDRINGRSRQSSYLLTHR